MLVIEAKIGQFEESYGLSRKLVIGRVCMSEILTFRLI